MGIYLVYCARARLPNDSQMTGPNNTIGPETRISRPEIRYKEKF